MHCEDFADDNDNVTDPTGNWIRGAPMLCLGLWHPDHRVFITYLISYNILNAKCGYAKYLLET